MLPISHPLVLRDVSSSEIGIGPVTPEPLDNMEVRREVKVPHWENKNLTTSNA